MTAALDLARIRHDANEAAKFVVDSLGTRVLGQDVPALIDTIERLSRRLAGRFEETAQLRAEVERLTQENARLRDERGELAGPMATQPPITPAERDVIEKAKAWRAALKAIAEDEGGPDDDWDGQKHMDAAHELIAAVDALAQPAEDVDRGNG